ncbi:MAG: hypothetical protein JW841_06455 [Deltaproteobacteria bacterium]|nr:hypothetical protein [Deltaproteobacteria bacterium]
MAATYNLNAISNLGIDKLPSSITELEELCDAYVAHDKTGAVPWISSSSSSAMWVEMAVKNLIK